MKRLLVLLPVLLLSCAVPPEQPVANSAQNEALKSMIAVQMLDRNAVHLLCDQSGYHSCFQQNAAECAATLEPHRQYCVMQTREGFKTLPSSETEVKQYSGMLVSCMTMRHIAEQPGRFQQASQCLKNLSAVMDKEQVQRSLQK